MSTTHDCCLTYAIHLSHPPLLSFHSLLGPPKSIQAKPTAKPDRNPSEPDRKPSTGSLATADKLPSGRDDNRNEPTPSKAKPSTDIKPDPPEALLPSKAEDTGDSDDKKGRGNGDSNDKEGRGKGDSDDKQGRGKGDSDDKEGRGKGDRECPAGSILQKKGNKCVCPDGRVAPKAGCTGGSGTVHMYRVYGVQPVECSV